MKGEEAGEEGDRQQVTKAGKKRNWEGRKGTAVRQKKRVHTYIQVESRNFADKRKEGYRHIIRRGTGTER